MIFFPGKLRTRFTNQLISLATLALVGSAMSISATPHIANAQEANWIWSPSHEKDSVPQGSCHFRKSFTVETPESGQIMIAADDSYELFVNGKRVGTGESWKKLDQYDISPFLKRGTNTVAIKVSNSEGSTAAVAARVLIKDQGGAWRGYSTDDSWRTNLRPLPLWYTSVYNDRGWKTARSYGQLGQTQPWDEREGVVSNDHEQLEQFTVSSEFEVQRVMDGSQLGSLIAMTFDEFGQIIASEEGGPLVLIYDSNRDNVLDKTRVICDKVKNCQGILSLNGEVFVTGQGPDGNALYRLSDSNRDGTLDKVRSIMKFNGASGEHGAHGLTLGPDGLIYVVMGNHNSVEGDYSPFSPHRDFYEGDLISERYEDPAGHAVGVKAPGGIVYRTDTEGNAIQLVAGGLRNSYDIAFNSDGELFTFDSDMESDVGAPWYRPTRVCHIISGAEFGWRSGWSKWPEYYPDSLGPILNVGRGSPTGLTHYSHFMYPPRYHGAIFMADWSMGQIIVVHTNKSGASYTANSEIFLEGSPLNVTDLEVGPDGSIYFTTGGRGTSGGLYRVVWKGTVPESLYNLGEGISVAIRQPQLNSAWSRQKIAILKNEIGGDWGRSLLSVARNTSNPANYRVRALQLMQLYGPVPDKETLIELSGAKAEMVRAKVAELLGLYRDEATKKRLIELLEDDDLMVRRRACEAMVHAHQTAPYESLAPLLRSNDRYEAWAARRLLERLPSSSWRDQAISAEDHREFIHASLALMIANPDKQNAIKVIQQSQKLMKGFVSDRNFVDFLRVIQVAILRGDLDKNDTPGLAEQLAEEFPAGESNMNQELVRLLIHLQDTSVLGRYFEYLKSDDVDEMDKLHLAMRMRFLESGWTPDYQFELLNYYKKASKFKGGGSYPYYIKNVTRDFAKSLNDEDSWAILSRGNEWPDAAVGVLYRMPKNLDAEILNLLKELDQKIIERNDKEIQSLKVGIVAVLARSGDPDSLAYLREIWDRDPQRREEAAMGLAQSPDGENWEYLIRSLPVLDGPATKAVLMKLRTVPNRPEEAEHYRQVILKGLKLKENGAEAAVSLLEYWTGEVKSNSSADWEQAIAAWQKWFAKKYPDLPQAKLPEVSANNKWQYDELLKYLSSDEGVHGSSQRGAAIYEKAQCAKCHRFGEKGDSKGPELTNLKKRFMKKEILESIFYPSHVISDQYASQTIIDIDGNSFTGMVAPAGAGEISVLLANGERHTISESSIEEIRSSKVSAMPEGLLDILSLEDISDLFTYLGVGENESVVRKNERTIFK